MVQLTEAQRKVVEFIFERMRDTGMPPTLREICGHLGWNAVGSAQDVVSALRKKGYLLPPERGKARQIVLSQWAQDFLQGGNASANASANGNGNGNGNGHSLSAARENAPYSRIPPGQLSSEILWVPLLGLVQAGDPNEAIEHASQIVPFHFGSATKRGADNFFALTVDGYSMLNAGFLPGDHLLIERASSARDGEIVVAAPTLGEVTVKRFALRGSKLFQKAMESLSSLTSFGETPPALLIPENPVFEPIPFGNREDARILGLVRALMRPVVQ